MQKHINSLIILLFLSGCAALPRTGEPITGYVSADGLDCIDYYSGLDSYVTKHGLADVQARRIPGFPFLRVDRFLASYSGQPLSSEETAFWAHQLAWLDLEGRRVETAAIPLPALQQIIPQATDHESVQQTLRNCSSKLLSRLLAASSLQELKQRATVPDNYMDMVRVIGLYPLTSLPVMAGVQQLHAQTRRRMEQPLTAVTGQPLIRYAPGNGGRMTEKKISFLIDEAGKNPLGIPLFSPAGLQSLFRHFAPVFEIETAGSADLPGSPVWGGGSRVSIDTNRPVTFTHISYTRFENQVLAQLNYTIWFPERPLEGRLDLLGGHLDGITWRVTLDASGQPLIYDVIHNCGCYHIVYAAEHLEHRADNSLWQEPMLVFPMPAGNSSVGRAVLSIASGNHYLSGIRHERPAGPYSHYMLADYDQLRQLPYRAGTARSMFDSRGLVPGSERAERWLLWPMGVPEPGAMRQWGHHAIAFIGKRHFDDPYLWDQYFNRPD